MKHILAIAVGLVIVFGFMAFQGKEIPSLGLAVCTPVESVVHIGDDEAVSVVAAGARSWAIIQQPVKATNTVSLSLGGTAVSGQGYTLYPSITASTTDHLKLGFATDIPTSVGVSAITDVGSSTINVIVCR